MGQNRCFVLDGSLIPLPRAGDLCSAASVEDGTKPLWGHLQGQMQEHRGHANSSGLGPLSVHRGRQSASGGMTTFPGEERPPCPGLEGGGRNNSSVPMPEPGHLCPHKVSGP